MKKTTLSALLALVTLVNAPVSSLGQGYFLFDNSSMFTGDNTSPVLITIGPLGQGGQGAVGQVIGSGGLAPNYSVSFLWATGLPGSYANWDAFAAVATLGGAEATQYDLIAPTGDTANGAGIFTGGNATLNGTGAATGVHVTVAVVAWYNPGGNTIPYQAALVSGNYNHGHGQLMDIRLAVGADPVIADMSGMQGFIIPQIPEPSSFSLAALGVGLMLLRRRRSESKQRVTI